MNLLIGHIETGTTVIEEAYIYDGDIIKENSRKKCRQRMTKDGENISKFLEGSNDAGRRCL